jgi:hypothetical protein
LDRALEALGGKDRLAAIKAVTASTIWVARQSECGHPLIQDYTSKVFWQAPDRIRHERVTDTGDVTAQAFDRKGGWSGSWAVGKWVSDYSEKEATGKRPILMMEELVQLEVLRLRATKAGLRLLGVGKLGNRPVLGVKVHLPDEPEIHLWIDKENGLPLMLMAKCKTGTVIETLFEDYQEVKGAKYPGKFVTIVNGEERCGGQIKEFKLLDKLPDETFARPKK